MRRIAMVVIACLLAAGCSGAAADKPRKVSAIFPTTSQLFVGSEVRVLGVEVGHVTAIVPQGDTVRVDMEVANDRPLPADVGAVLVPVSLLGERIVQLEPPYTGGPRFQGGTIPIERTAVPAEVDQVLRSFQSFASALDEKVLAELIDTAAETLEGQGPGLNRLIGQGADTVEILADASDELNALVAELGELNSTLARRDEKIGRTLERLSTVMRTFAEEKDDIIGSIANLRRLTAELRPLVDEHTDPLIRDLEVLTTSLSTVNRNLDRVAGTYRGSRRLFAVMAQEVTLWEDGQAKLNNRGEQLPSVIELRLVERLEGLCIRLNIDECANDAFWEPKLPDITCLSGDDCAREQASLGDALALALRELPPEGRKALARDVRRRRAQTDLEPTHATPAPRPRQPRQPLEVPDPQPEQAPQLPLPDPRLDSLDTSAVLGGGS